MSRVSRSPAADAATRAGVRFTLGFWVRSAFTVFLSFTDAAVASSLDGGLAFLAMNFVPCSTAMGARVDMRLFISFCVICFDV